MTTAPKDFIARGMAAPTATETATQIDGTESAVRLMGLGIPQALASELASQMALGNVPPAKAIERLMGLGVNPILAGQIVTAIAVANA